MRSIFILTLCLLFVSVSAVEYDSALHADGSLHYKIKLNKDGQRHGKYTLYFPSGKAKKKGKKQEIGSYKNGKIHGLRSIADDKGTLISEEIFFHGELVYPASQRFLEMRMKELSNESQKHVSAFKQFSNEGTASRDVLSAVLTRVNTYRLLCGLPTDVGYSDEYIHFAQEGAELCKAIGRIEHTPKNPGIPEKAYTDGYNGTSHGNLFMGRNGASTIDGYMDDSDNSNRDRVGHRRWILWNNLDNIGHGDSGKMSCLFVIGESKSPKVDTSHSAFPPQGYMPLSMFATHYAWHISPHKNWYSIQDKAELNAYRLNPKTLKKIGEAIPMKFRNVDRGGFGKAPAIIAQPDKLILKKGDCFRIEITGVKKLREDAPDLNYIVSFY